MEIAGHKWLFKKATSAHDASILLTEVDGKVFEFQMKLKAQKEKRKLVKDPEKMLTEEPKKAKTANGKAKAKAKPKAASSSSRSGVVDDPSTTESQITMEGPLGTTLARNKYFVDCLFMGARTAIRAARSQWGPLPSRNFEHVIPEHLAISLDDVAAEDDDPMVYAPAELPLLRFFVKEALVFAFSGEVMVSGKLHKRWSSCRPALQTATMNLYKKASCFVHWCVVMMVSMF